MIDFQSAQISRAGSRTQNEDAQGCWVSETACCWIVSDGAGGHGSGDIASQLVISTVLQGFAQRPEVSVENLHELLLEANRAVIAEKTTGATHDNMHATVVVFLADRQTGKSLWGHVGDSRCYVFRDGNVFARTRDHSLVQEFVDAGYLTVEAVRRHPQRNYLTSAIGSPNGGAEPTILQEPLTVLPGDVVLLCSDGWWEGIEEGDMCRSLAETSTALSWLEAMEAIITAVPGREHDNFTALAIGAEPWPV